MRFVVLLFGAGLFTLIGCATGIPPAVAPGGASLVAPPPPPPPLAPAPAAPSAQPDPESPHAREIRAEEVLGTIARVAGRVRARENDARAERDRGRAECIAGRLGELDAIERAAIGSRDRLRGALFDEGEAAKAAWAELVGHIERAEAIASEANDCAGHDTLAAGGFGPNDATLRVPARVVRVRSPSLEADTSEAPNDLFVGHGKGSVAAHYASPVIGQAIPTPIPKVEAAHDASMLLRSAQLALAVFEVEKNVDAVEKIAGEAGGYLALRGDRQITVRVPKSRFDDAIRRIERLGDVLHRNVSSEDVTDQYVDLELRLKNATAVRARLEKLLEHATVKDAVEIHRELAKVTDEIERLEGKLKLLKDRVAFATITVTFERSQSQQVRAQALLPFPWMQTMGLEPLLRVNR